MTTGLVIDIPGTSWSALVRARDVVDRLVLAWTADQPVPDLPTDRVERMPPRAAIDPVPIPALISLLEAERPDVILGPHASAGLAVLPAVATVLDAPFLPGITDCTLDGASFTVKRRFGRSETTVSGTVPFVASVRRQPDASSGPGGREPRSIDELPDPARAEIVIGVGRGAVDALDAIVTLADQLEAGVVGTKPVVDAGVFPPDALAGQHGLTIAPEVYVAVGISGSFHHLRAVRDARSVIAITTDPHAPIVELATDVVIGDATAVLGSVNDRLTP